MFSFVFFMFEVLLLEIKTSEFDSLIVIILNEKHLFKKKKKEHLVVVAGVLFF